MAGLLDFLSPQENPNGLVGLRGALLNFANPELAMKMKMLQGQMAADRQAGEMLGSDTGASPQAPMPPVGIPGPSADAGGDPFAGAISKIESGGKYDALGPTTRTGDRAYGKYQVMGANVGPWTKEVLGQEMTPEQFLASPQAQDAVFKSKFGSYAQKYGPEGAARAWFAGEGGMNDLGRKDQLGTTVGGYGQKFAANLGQQPTQVASLAPAGMPMPGGPMGPPMPQTAQAPAGPQLAQAAAPQTAPPANPNNPALQEQIAKLSKMLTNPMLGPGAQAAVKARLEALIKSGEPTPALKEYSVDRQPGETLAAYEARRAGMKSSAEGTPKIKEYQLYKDQGGKLSFDDWSNASSIAESERAVQKDVLGTFTKRLDAGFDQANAAADALRASNDLRAQLDAKGGIFSGAWADNRLALAKLTEFLGKPLDPRITNTETFKSVVGQQVAALVKNFGSGTSITNQDREYAEKMAAGDIKLDETSIRRVFDIIEKMNRAKIDKHNELVGKVAKGAPAGAELVGAFKVDAPEGYKAPSQTQTSGGGMPQVGTIVNGHRYLGGNPNSQASWAPIGQ